MFCPVNANPSLNKPDDAGSQAAQALGMAWRGMIAPGC
jgi:hypothetical protein